MGPLLAVVYETEKKWARRKLTGRKRGEKKSDGKDSLGEKKKNKKT